MMNTNKTDATSVISDICCDTTFVFDKEEEPCDENSLSATEASSFSSLWSSALDFDESERKVRFGYTEVIELRMMKGDHPECRTGPAVCLSSRVVRRWKVRVSMFQRAAGRKGRTNREMLLSTTERRRIVRNASKPLGDCRPNTRVSDWRSQITSLKKKEDTMVVDHEDQRFNAIMARMSVLDEITSERRRRQAGEQRRRQWEEDLLASKSKSF